jgi:OFA family oxalate/formate antiporter-like MFS transporter
MFPIQAAIFALLPRVESFALLTMLACVVLLCYGGGFGTMPAFVADYFGAENVGSIYGLMLTAWGFAGVVGPMLIAALRETTGRYDEALYVIAALMLVSSAIPAFVRPPAEKLESGVAASAVRSVRL